MQARVVVTAELEVASLGNWGSECTLAQVNRQAIESAKARLQRLIASNGGVSISKINVGRVIFEEEK